jgi:hypothetical protein
MGRSNVAQIPAYRIIDARRRIVSIVFAALAATGRPVPPEPVDEALRCL